MIRNHRVQAGETLGTISQKYYGSTANWKAIADANQLANPNLIKPGQLLAIPEIKGVVAQETYGPMPAASGPSILQRYFSNQKFLIILVLGLGFYFWRSGQKNKA